MMLREMGSRHRWRRRGQDFKGVDAWMVALYRKRLSPRFIYKAPNHKDHDTNSRHHRTRHAHPRRDTKVPGTATPPQRLPSHYKCVRTNCLEPPETSSSEGRGDGNDRTRTPRWCLQEGNDHDSRHHPIPKIGFSPGATRRRKATATEPTRRIRCPRTPPPSANTRLGR